MNVCSVVTYLVVVVIVILLLVLLFKGNKTENFQVSTAPTTALIDLPETSQLPNKWTPARVSNDNLCKYCNEKVDILLNHYNAETIQPVLQNIFKTIEIIKNSMTNTSAASGVTSNILNFREQIKLAQFLPEIELPEKYKSNLSQKNLFSISYKSFNDFRIFA